MPEPLPAPTLEAQGVAYSAVRGSGAVVDPRRVVVAVSGVDAASYLQGQCSQDVAGLAEGASAWSWILQPTGKVDALVRVSHGAGDDWYVDTDSGWGEAVLARLGRFKLRTKVDMSLSDWRVVGVRGSAGAEGASGVVVAADASWPGLPGVDLIGPTPTAPPGLPAADAAVWQAVRIEAGIPVMGAELGPRTIPGETGLIERTVSFTKGCYTGQELVARIDSRGGNVARHLVGLRLDGPATPGSPLTSEGSEVGTVTSTGWSPALGHIGLGYLKRSADPGAPIQSTGVAVRAGGLPLVG